MFQLLRNTGFDLDMRNHAQAILTTDFAEEMNTLVQALLAFKISAPEIIQSGGGQAASTMRLRDSLYRAGWPKHVFTIQTAVDGERRESTTHEVDHFKRSQSGGLALEIEWNNKDPFFDRDLDNFHRLHAQGAISVGILITRGASLQNALVEIVHKALKDAKISGAAELRTWGVKERTERQTKNLDALRGNGVGFAEAFARSFVSDKFGASTTHWAKLADRVSRGVGNPCPLLLIGLPLSCVVGYSAATPEL